MQQKIIGTPGCSQVCSGSSSLHDGGPGTSSSPKFGSALGLGRNYLPWRMRTLAFRAEHALE
eukprot:8047167-Alexandrium_andersonii.AAC.1